eukprot:CAMPEP_0173290064 /NCGR_PEP_ID=MMETSP1143-20121109/11355_1 /TAXON_ID=483371 /ORGANISM="non described non described, Strain CCMP2298" /LENGTH=108 /DNA_ID=CAMNT_0014229079 /DNA_START=132 /DNA_END=454 /DNA_ORIENTATION=+
MKAQPKGAAPISRADVEVVKRKMAAPSGPPPAGMSLNFKAPKAVTQESRYDEYDNEFDEHYDNYSEEEEEDEEDREQEDGRDYRFDGGYSRDNRDGRAGAGAGAGAGA